MLQIVIYRIKMNKYGLSNRLASKMMLLLGCLMFIGIHGQGRYRLHEIPVNLEDANQVCASNGGSLLDSSKLQDKQLMDIHNSLLPEEFVWINGNVLFTPLMEFMGSVRLGHWSTRHESMNTISDNDILKCSMFCDSVHEWRFIGLSENTCFCFSYLPTSTIGFATGHFITNNAAQTGDNSSAFLYHKHFRPDMWDDTNLSTEHRISPVQCAYAIAHVISARSGEFHVHSDHIYIRAETNCNATVTDGYVCENISAKVCAKHSHWFSLGYCYIPEKVTWSEAYQTCIQLEGILANGSFFNTPLEHFNLTLINRKMGCYKARCQYWVRLFIVSQISFDTQYTYMHTQDNLCLAARILSNSEIAVSNCSQKRHFVCWNADEGDTILTKDTSFGPILTKDNSFGSSMAPILTKDNSFGSRSALILQVSSAWIGVLVLVFAVCMCTCVSMKRGHCFSRSRNAAVDQEPKETVVYNTIDNDEDSSAYVSIDGLI